MSSAAAPATAGRPLVVLFLPLVFLLLQSCGTPTWSVDRSDRAEPMPPRALLVQDGRVRQLPDPGEEEPIPYYGTVEIAAVPAPAADDAPAGDLPLPRHTDRRFVELAPPVSPWLFPLDFFVEMALLPFTDDRIATVQLSPPPRDPAVAGVPGDPAADAAELDALQERARARVRER